MIRLTFFPHLRRRYRHTLLYVACSTTAILVLALAEAFGWVR